MVRLLMALMITGTITCATASWLLWPEKRLTLDDFNRVKVGMTRMEVQKTLRKPGLAFDKSVVWVAEEGCYSLEVSFGADDRVTDALTMPCMKRYSPPAGPIARFRKWIGF